MQYRPSDIFHCTNCGHCCKGYGGTLITDRDVHRIADFMNMGKTRFISEYCQYSGGRLVVAQGDGGYCALWNNGCTIHPVKPRMCKAWPFIESVARDIANWQIMAGECPGIRTDVPDAEIVHCVRHVLGSL